MTSEEIKIRCIEAAAKAPQVHADGFAVGVLETAKLWSAWVQGITSPTVKSQSTLTLKK